MWNKKPRLLPPGVLANPRNAKEHRCGLRLARQPNPSVFFSCTASHCTRQIARDLASVIRYLLSVIRYLASGIWHLLSGICYLAPGTWHLASTRRCLCLCRAQTPRFVFRHTDNERQNLRFARGAVRPVDAKQTVKTALLRKPLPVRKQRNENSRVRQIFKVARLAGQPTSPPEAADARDRLSARSC